MGKPAIDYGPWSFDVNNDCSEVVETDTYNHATVGLKDSLIAHSAWSVVASSDGVSVKNIGDASPDLWTDWTTCIVKNLDGYAHSWIILENSTTGEQICIDLNSNSTNRCPIWYSATGSFSDDGTITDRPTATEIVTIYYNNSTPFDSGLDGAIVHTMVSNDNKTTRAFIYQRDATAIGSFFLAFEEVRNPCSEWTDTYKRAVYAKTINITVSATPTVQSPKLINFETSGAWKVYLNGTWSNCYPTCECFKGFNGNSGDPFYLETDATWSGNRMVQPIGLFREEIADGGRLGFLGDIYYAPSDLPTYDMSDATKQDWIKVGGIMVPWNDTVPLDVP